MSEQKFNAYLGLKKVAEGCRIIKMAVAICKIRTYDPHNKRSIGRVRLECMTLPRGLAYISARTSVCMRPRSAGIQPHCVRRLTGMSFCGRGALLRSLSNCRAKKAPVRVTILSLVPMRGNVIAFSHCCISGTKPLV